MQQRLSKAIGVYFIVYGALVAIGGLLGLVRAGSWISLLMGLGCGLMLVLSGISTGRGKRIGQRVAGFIAVGLTAWFGARYWWTGKMMPAGMVLIMSLGALALLGILRVVGYISAILEKQK
jgi:uncharacterized membrane protein (UPF0136 family)